MIKINDLCKNQRDMIGITLSYALRNDGHIDSDIITKLIVIVKPELDSITSNGNYRASIAARFIIAALVGDNYIHYTGVKKGNTKDYILTWRFKDYFKCSIKINYVK